MRLKVFRRCVFAISMLVFVALSILMASQAYAQVSGATLSGTVTDSSGAVIPNAQVAILDVSTGVTRTVTTGGAGFYTAPNLLPGIYEIRATAPGFSTQVHRGITLTVGAEQALDIKMQVGQVSQTVEVTTEAPTVELTSSTLSAVVNATTVRELPLNGRSWTDLATLQPGVNQIVTMQAYNDGGSGRGNRGFGSQITIAGARPTQNNYRLDGVSINDYANGAPGSVLGGNLGVDAIQEFSVLTGNYSAEYGKTSGGVVNAITRSGTNQFHGSAYEFMRNSALDARNFFDGPTPPPFKRNQFGASLGGPIQKDHTFIFGDYEGIRQALGLTQINFVPSPDARKGILHDSSGNPLPPLVGACPPPPNKPSTNLAPGQASMCVDDQAARFLAFFPLPNQGLISPDVGKYANALNQKTGENYFTIRLDRKFSDKDSIFGTYVFDKTSFTAPDQFSNVLLNNVSFRQIVAIEESHTFSSTFVNSVRFGFHRTFVNNTEPLAAINPLAADPSYAAVPGQDAPILRIAPGTFALMPGGLAAGPLYHYRWNTFQGYDDAFLTKGRHTIKFGVAFERDQNNQLTGGGFAGNFMFASLATYYANQPSNFTSNLPGFLSERGLRQSIFGAYIQDDWHMRSNLTVNLGLRYEMSTVPTEVQGKLSNLINLTDPTPHLGDPFFLNPTKRNFEPRVGFSWDPFHNGKTALRGGFGIFDVLPLLYEFITLNGQAAPFYASSNTSSGLAGTFPTGAIDKLVALGPTALRYIYVEQQPKRNYVMQWNLNVQQQITPSLTATVGYVGSHGIHQPFRVDDADTVIPTLTSAGYLWPAPLGSGTRINTTAGSIRAVKWAGGSRYDDLEAKIQKQMSHGFQLQGSFTWGKSFDNSSSVVAGNAFQNSISSPDFYDLSLNHAVSDFNIGRTLVINGVWQVPRWQSAMGLRDFVANGWQLGVIFKVNDGPPFTPVWGSGGDPAKTKSSDVTYAYPNRKTDAGCETLINPGNPDNYIKNLCFNLPTAPSMAFWQANCDHTTKVVGSPATTEPFPTCFNLRGNAGRNIANGPGLTNVDLSLFKNNYVRRISENFNVQFRAEVFNILNHANFGPPLTPVNVFTSNGTPTSVSGHLTTTVTTSRQLQFALKVGW
jgi:hypothetical protein